MHSQDFIELMKKIHSERYIIHSKRIEFHNYDNNPLAQATVVLEKDGKQSILQSSEMDFFQFVVQVQSIVDISGDYKFSRIKDLNQYWVDVEHLIDLDKTKAEKAVEDLLSGKFTFTYNPTKLVDELLENKKNVSKNQLLKLKSDYYYVLAANLLQSKNFLVVQDRIIKKFPESKKYIDSVEQILISFRPTGNGIKDYKFYKSFLNFDIDSLLKRWLAQEPVMDDTIKEFIKRGSIAGNIAVPKLMNIYSRYLELSSPIINFIRIGLELKRGKSSPLRLNRLNENIPILKSDPDYGAMFNCLDAAIRHADAHAAIDVKKGEVNLMDVRGTKAKIIRTYQFEELIKIEQIMRYELFPALIITLCLQDIVALDLVLVSPEYKRLLLSIGNS